MMKLNIENWGEFKISELFPTLIVGKANQDKLTEGSDCFYVGAKKDDNGVMVHCAYDSELILKGNCIVFICNGEGSVGYANYMNVDFIGSTDIVAGYNERLNQYNGLFIATVLCKERPKYSFGRKWKSHLKDTIIKLPQTEDGTPDWTFMEMYIKSLHYKPITTKIKQGQVEKINTNDWKEFVLSDIFTLKGGFYNKKPEHSVDGDFPFLASTDSNNGVTEYYAVDDIKAWDKVGKEDDSLDKKIYNGNCIAVTVNGSVCNAYYQKDEFTCSHDITALYARDFEMNASLALFFCTIIMGEKYRWSYGRKPHDIQKFAKSIIKLPILHNDEGEPIVDSQKKYSSNGYIPDFKFMESYVNSLPYGDKIDS